MLVHAVDGQVQKFPYTLADLRLAHPQLSIPDSITDEELAAFNVYPVQATARPAFDNKTHRLRQSAEYLGATWQQVWTTEQLPESQAAANVRNYRNELLSACDWTQLIDSPLDADAKLAWQLYRETLRMVPQQPGFPWNVTWPSVPGS
jgi:hypothetical protein